MVSVLPIDIKSDWKRFTQEFEKCSTLKKIHNIKEFYATKSVDSLIKQFAVRIEIFVRKAFSFNTHDYKNTKMTEVVMMTPTAQLPK